MGLAKVWPYFNVAGPEVKSSKYLQLIETYSYPICFFNRRNGDMQNSRFYTLLSMKSEFLCEKTEISALKEYSKTVITFDGLFDFIKKLGQLLKSRLIHRNLPKVPSMDDFLRQVIDRES